MGVGWASGYWPVCGAWPILAEVRGLERARWLRCGRCGTGRSVAPAGCPYCGNADRRSAGYLAPERQRESRRAMTCDACRGYLKTLTTVQPIAPVELGLVDMQTLELDVAALERGFWTARWAGLSARRRAGIGGAPIEMAVLVSVTAILRPGAFGRQLLRALDASEGRRRRKRDQTPDGIGLAIKRDLLDAAILEDPEPADFEAWLLTRALAATGPVLALCGQIMDEYRVAVTDPRFGRWLADGAPSADADTSSAAENSREL